MTTAETDAQHEAHEAEEAFYVQCEAETKREISGLPLWYYALLSALVLLMLILAFAAEKRAPFLPKPVHSLFIQKGH